MAVEEHVPEVTVWADGQRVALVRQVLDLMGSRLRLIGVGGHRDSQLDAFASDLGSESFDDLRRMVIDRPSAFLFLASMEGVSTRDVEAAVDKGTTVLGIEPVRSQINRVAVAERDRRALRDRGRFLLTPPFSACSGWMGAAEPHEVLGTVRLVSTRSVGPASSGSLFARLFDVWRLVLQFTDMPHNVAASLVGRSKLVPDELRQAAGLLAAHGRSSAGMDGCAVLVEVSDDQVNDQRAAHLVADGGQLHVTDGGYRLFDASGKLIDNLAPPPQPPARPALIADYWQQLLDRRLDQDLAADPDKDTAALACCLTCLLSARTGQSESPSNLIEAHGGP